MMARRLRLVGAVVVVLMAVGASNAGAWSNGTNGCNSDGTHDWVTKKAIKAAARRLPGSEPTSPHIEGTILPATLRIREFPDWFRCCSPYGLERQSGEPSCQATGRRRRTSSREMDESHG